VLRREKGATYDRTFELLPPAVQTGILSVHPGETVRAVPLFEKGEFAGWREPKPDEPADTQILTIALSQSDKGAGMSAQVSTNSGPALKLRMGLIRLDGNDEPESTSSCPLMAGGFSSFEMWPYPIFVLLVATPSTPPPHRRPSATTRTRAGSAICCSSPASVRAIRPATAFPATSRTPRAG
jgi:hypothetical protein